MDTSWLQVQTAVNAISALLSLPQSIILLELLIFARLNRSTSYTIDIKFIEIVFFRFKVSNEFKS